MALLEENWKDVYLEREMTGEEAVKELRHFIITQILDNKIHLGRK